MSSASSLFHSALSGSKKVLIGSTPSKESSEKILPPIPATPLNICCVSWNVGNENPKSLVGLLPPRVPKSKSVDIFVFGFQECTYGNTKLDFDLAEIRGYLKNALKSTQKHCYVEISHATLGQMKVLVFVRRSLRDVIDEIHTVTEATGIAGVVGNKGGLCVGMRLYGTTRIAFISAHLNAHRGGKHITRRNNDVSEILRSLCHSETKRLSSRVGNPLAVFDHLFFMGDLNYRLNVEDLSKDLTVSSDSVLKAKHIAETEKWFTKKSEKKQKNGVDTSFLTDWVRVHEAIPKNKMELLKVDELKKEMRMLNLSLSLSLNCCFTLCNT